MSESDHIEIVLLGLDEVLGQVEGSVDGLGDAVDGTSGRINDLERRFAALTGAPAPSAVVEPESPRRPPRSDGPATKRAESLDDLIGEREAKAIETRFRRDTTTRARLDRYDVIASIAAGLAGTLVDLLLVRVPNESSVTNWLRDHALTDDNWLSHLAKVPYDQVAGTGVSGMSPMSHRVQTQGHDPLLGFAVGTADIMNGRMTTTDRNGGLHYVTSSVEGVDSVVGALGIQVLHLLSDVCTTAGLPLPGWTALTTNGTMIGGQPISEVARGMYIRGYDSWHLWTMKSTPATIELGCRLYWHQRSLFDPTFEQHTDLVEDDPRYRSISLLAHGVAVACDAAQLSITGNPLTLNWSQWMSFAVEMASWLKATAPLPSEDLSRQFAANRARLDTGWEGVWAAGALPIPPMHQGPVAL